MGGSGIGGGSGGSGSGSTGGNGSTGGAVPRAHVTVVMLPSYPVRGGPIAGLDQATLVTSDSIVMAAPIPGGG
jgi:hypothetical protein